MNISDTSGAITTIETSLRWGKAALGFRPERIRILVSLAPVGIYLGKRWLLVFILAGKNNIHKSLELDEISQV